MTKRVFQISILLSLLLHISTAVLLALKEPSERKSKTYVEFELTTPDEKKNTDEKNAQIVEQKKTVNEDIPDNAKFLSQFNQKVVKETRARDAGNFDNKAGRNGDDREMGQKKPKISKAAQVLPKEKTATGLPTIESLKPKFDWDSVSQNNLLNGRGPSGSKTDDYLKDIDKGDETLLNTREFVYYSYYTRIKNQLKQYWEPKLKEKVTRLLRRGRKIASNTDRVTKVIIVLDGKGLLKKVQVIGQSGVEDLDQAAVEAFEAAAPFPNPPRGIVDADGYIKIRWDFVIEG